MNVYRNTESYDDWEYAKMRVLLSKVSNVCNIDENIIDVHIPADGGSVYPEVIDEAFALAENFFKKHFPEYE